jgi:DNA-binding transcriptional LysR family regulator
MVSLTEEGLAVGERVSALLQELEAAVRSRTGGQDLPSFFRVISAIEEACQ